MNPWSNIVTSVNDTEITEIDKFERSLKEIPASVLKIHELITRFEVCHFKYQQHFKNIYDSIINLESFVDPGKIGSNHINKGENARINDKTGRSLTGRQYLWVLKYWLTATEQDIIPEH